VPQADELEQVIDGKLTPLPDGGAVTIKGGEVFMSHVRSGGSS
jgi:ethanolamine utilization protein EutQ (cupin superfamily)